MHKKVAVLTALVAMLAAAGFASTNSVTGGASPSPAAQRTPAFGPAPVVPAQVPGNAGSTTIRWDKFYDRQGNLLPDDPQDNVGSDSLYCKNYYSLTALLGSPKSEVPNPTPESCRPAFAWQNAQPVACMDPQGVYCYEVFNTTLRRTNTNTGAYADYTIAHGESACGTDGQYLYVPVDNTVYKYTLTGTLVTTTTLDVSPAYYEFSVANDTVWCHNGSSTVLNGYACSRFTGGSLTADATWDVGTGSNSPAQVAWDGQYYYVSWAGFTSNTFKRFNADRTLSASGTISIDTRGVMSSVRGTRLTTQDSLYWKSLSSNSLIYSSPKTQDVTPAQPSAFSWQANQSVPCMTPDGYYVFEVYSTNLRRTDLITGEVNNYTLAVGGLGACGTDGEYVYIPNGDTTRKYTLGGSLVTATRTDYQAIYGGNYGFGVANDTVWLTPDHPGTTWYGYACSGFTGGSITHDATWTTAGGDHTAMTVVYDGQYYYVSYGGHATNTLLRFHRDRTLYSSGTVSDDSRGVMCKQADYAVAICYAASYHSHVASLGQMLVDSSGGKFAAVDSYYVGTSGGHVTFPATDWYNHGYRAVLAFTDGAPIDSVALGDSLARFVQLGGGVVEAPFSDYSGVNISGAWRSLYAPFTLQSYSGSPGTMGTVHQPLHPIMSGVSALSVSDWRTGNTHSSLRSANCACLSEYTDGNLCLAAGFDSAGQRAASLGFYPLDYWIETATGQWCRMIVNALEWTAVGPSVGVTVPNGGESWVEGTVHNITWTQTANGVKDSIYYSTDAGSSWTGVGYYDPSPVPLQHAWTVPSTPTTRARVKVVTWDADGGRVEDMSDANFTIEPYVGIEQPEKNVLPLVFALYQPFPNPLASGAQIRYALPRPARVELHVYDVAGTLVRRLVDGTQSTGYQSAYWNGRDEHGRSVATGVYYCRFRADNFLATQKLIVRR